MALVRAVLAAMLVLGLLGVSAQGARAAAPAKTDILLMFDTTGSMGSALSAAAAQVSALTGNIDSRLPDVQYGVAEVRDYAKYDSGTDPYAYKVNQAITADRGAVTAAINTLVAKGGGDGPEAYGGALAAATVGTGFGWRPGARRLVVLIADNVPHDEDLNLDIPADKQTKTSPWNTGADPGPDGTVGTADDVDWQPLLDAMAYNGISLAYVLFKGNSTYLPYWNIWATRTGGAAVDATDSDLGTKIADIAAAGATAELPACPAGSTRDAAGICDPRHVTGAYVQCNRGPNPGDSSGLHRHRRRRRDNRDPDLAGRPGEVHRAQRRRLPERRHVHAGRYEHLAVGLLVQRPLLPQDRLLGIPGHRGRLRRQRQASAGRAAGHR